MFTPRYVPVLSAYFTRMVIVAHSPTRFVCVFHEMILYLHYRKEKGKLYSLKQLMRNKLRFLKETREKIY